MSKQNLYLIGMKINNFLKLENFDYVFDGKSISIAGPNASGKTTLLKAVWAACLGQANVPADAINTGKEKAEIEINLGDLVVKRTITKTGAYLTVKDSRGFGASNPQTILDRLVGKISLDPHAFMEMDDKKQLEAAGQIFGVKAELDKIDAEIKGHFEERTIVNRQCKELQAKLQGAKPEPFPTEVPDIAELEALEDKYLNLDMAYRDEARIFENAKQALNNANEKLEQLRVELDSWTKRRDEIQVNLSKSGIEVEKIVTEAKALPHSRDQIRAKISEARTIQQEADRRQLAIDAWEAQFKEFDEKEEHASQLSATIDKLRQDRQQVVAGAQIPVEGIGFEDGALLLNGHPFRNASHAEQLRASIGVLMAQDPELKLLTIKDASLMDKKSWAVVEELSDLHKFQVLYEVVSDDPGAGGIFLEDGKVTHVNGEKVQPADEPAPKKKTGAKRKAKPADEAPEASMRNTVDEESAAIEEDADREMGDERGLFS